MTPIIQIILSVVISSIVALVIEEIMFRLRVPQNTESKDEYHGRLYWESKDPLDGNSKLPQNSLFKMINYIGSPSCVDRNKGGSAVWKEKDLRNTKFVRAEIIDEMIPHDSHYDFFTVWIPMSIAPEKSKNLNTISKSANYDPLKRWLSVRCYNLQSIVVTMWLIKKYSDGDYSLDKVLQEHKPRLEEINNEKEGLDSKLFKQYYSYL
jgi:hypothetical protein